MKRYVTIVAVLLASFGFLSVASAASLGQLDYGVESPCADKTTGEAAFQTLGDNLFGSPTQVSIMFTSCVTTTTDVLVTLLKNGGNVGEIAREAGITYTSGTVYQLNMPVSGVSFEPGDDYMVQIGTYNYNDPGAPFGNFRLWGSSAATSYPPGSAHIASSSNIDEGETASANPVRDFYFELPGAGYISSTSSATGTIAISKPENGGTTYEFDFFDVYATSTLVPRQWIGVRYGTSTGVYAYEDMTQENDPDGTVRTFVYKTHTLVQSVNQERVWYFRAYLYDENDNVVASSSEVATFVKFSFKNVNVPTSTAPTSTDYFFIEHACPEGGGFLSSTSIAALQCHIMNGVRQIANEVFAGAQTAMQGFGNLVMKVWPMNMFAHIQRAFNEPTIASTSASVYLKYLDINLVMFTSSTIDDAGSRIGFDFRSFMDKVMYAVTGLVLAAGAVAIVFAMKDQ